MARTRSFGSVALVAGLVVGPAVGTVTTANAETASGTAQQDTAVQEDVVLRPWPVYRQGSREENVAVLQYLMRGYSSAFSLLPVDGVFGPDTAAAVRDYQRNRGLAPDGVVGAQTWSTLTREAVLRPDPRPSEWVRALQTELRRNEFDIAVDGIFGPRTEAAVRQAQQGAGLAVDGVVGPQTWRDLVTRHRD
ncbi:MAG: peptidoglycan-binding domain-containing protein [Actinomycetes bacterium]